MPEPTTSKYIEVKESSIHNKGVFAAIDIPKGTKILEYVGEVITKEEAEQRADVVIQESKEDKTKGAVYIFDLDDDHDIDGNVEWNTARYINHSCDPNCETENEDGHIWIIAIKKIKAGQEISYNYGYELEAFEEHPCRCGSPKCVGYIIKQEDWSKLRRKLAKKKRREKRLSQKQLPQDQDN